MKAVSRIWSGLLLASFVGVASAGLFDDDEARKAILDLRQRVENARVESEQRRTEDAGRAAEEAAVLKRSLLDFQNQLEKLRAELASLRGVNEQLTRDVADLQRRQKDVLQATEDRLRKLEPTTVAVDGREFLASPAEKRDFEAALAVFRRGDFAAAETAFVDFLNRNGQSGYRPSALFWVGNAQYANKDYKNALVNFRSLIASASDHSRVPEARLAVANCLLELKDVKGARRVLDELIAAHPGTETAAAAKDRLARLK